MSTILGEADRLRDSIGDQLHDRIVEGIYQEAEQIAKRAVGQTDKRAAGWDQALDRIFTSKLWGFPAMAVLFAAIFWITIAGANIPSAWLSGLLVEQAPPLLHRIAGGLGAPSWLSGILIDGVYLAAAWVVSVMLPPMAIFFPLFTLLEDFGYLPRVAFNLDNAFRWAGAHGKQSLTMMMGFGCNAAGVVSTRIIDSPRERLIAILTNNFSICNGRWPTMILVGTLFVGASTHPAFAGIVSSLAVTGVALLGILVTLFVSKFLSKTWLKGEASAFMLELPPYRPPRLLQTLATSVIDRTLIVLWRAVVMAAPAGAVIWLIGNVTVAGQSLAAWSVGALDPFGWFIGLNGVILVAYVIAIPANEIVIPTVLMLTLNLARSNLAQKGVMLELDAKTTREVLSGLGGWTLLTGANLMLFSLLHNPCSTTILTIYKETRSLKWTTVATVMPIVLAVIVCGIVAWTWRAFAGAL